MKSARVLAIAALIALNLSKLAVAENLPFDRTNPFIWDNDGESDCRSLTLCLALDKLGEMNLIGISHAPHPYQNQSEDYQHIVNLARATGWTGLPDATVGLGAFPKHALARPGSGAVHDTAPIDTAPAQMIKNQVLSVGTPAKPVVIGTGGCVTTVASAYLLANQEGRGVEFASKCVLYGVLGWHGSTRLEEYNCYQDPWALYVCIQQLRTYLIQVAPRTPYDTNNLRPFIDALPPSPLGDYMKSIHPGTFDPAFDPGGVIDGGPIFALYFPNQGQYFHQIFPVSFDFWGADVGDNIRNINCHRQIVHVRGDPSSNDRMTFSYDRDEINAWALDVFQRAFQGSTPTPTEATAPTPAPTTTPTPTLTSTPAPGNSVANPSFDADGFDTQSQAQSENPNDSVIDPNAQAEPGSVASPTASELWMNFPATVFQAAGPTVSSIQSTVDAYRAALGDPNNGNNPGPLLAGRREINWDGGGSTDTTTPVTPFNVFLFTRGGQFTTPGTGLSQAPPEGGAQGGLAVPFNNPTYGTIFSSFSSPRLFTPVGSNITEALFFIPGSDPPVPATVTGFGAVFSDVDKPDGMCPRRNRVPSTVIRYFGADNKVLFSSFVPASSGDASFSFFGIVFKDPLIARVRIIIGTAAPGPDDGGSQDIVVMDDFFYGEPQDAQSTVATP